MNDQGPIVLADYGQFLQDLKKRIRNAQVRAMLSVNRELVLLYWEIGRLILERQKNEGWGAKIIDRMSYDLKQSFPEMQGFSPRNLKYMGKFSNAWPSVGLVQRTVALIPCRSNITFWTNLPTPRFIINKLSTKPNPPSLEHLQFVLVHRQCGNVVERDLIDVQFLALLFGEVGEAQVLGLDGLADDLPHGARIAKIPVAELV